MSTLATCSVKISYSRRRTGNTFHIHYLQENRIDIRRFCLDFPSWASTTPAYPDISCPLHYTEAPTAYAAAQVGDKQSVDLWLMNSQINWVNPGRPYPWTVADSGFSALAAQKAATLQ